MSVRIWYTALKGGDEVHKVTDQLDGTSVIEMRQVGDDDYATYKADADAYLARPLSPEPTGTGATWSVNSAPQGTVVSVWDEITHEELVSHTVMLEPDVPLNFTDAGKYSIRVQGPAPAREVRIYFEVTDADIA